MKKSILFGLILSVFFISCSKENSDSLTADFTATITGKAPNAQISITNNSTGANKYLWSFDEGANLKESTEKTPNGLVVDKAGDFTITLTASSGGKQEVITKKISISGDNAIITYTDIEFAQKNGDTNYGRFFSTSKGKIYKDSEVNNTTGALIDLAYQGSNSTFIFFESPDNLYNSSFSIPNATTTKIKNYNSGFEVSTFDNMNDDKELSKLEITNDNEAIGSLNFPLIVLFENSKGKKGAIKLKKINSDRLLVDIKLQKY